MRDRDRIDFERPLNEDGTPHIHDFKYIECDKDECAAYYYCYGCKTWKRVKTDRIKAPDKNAMDKYIEKYKRHKIGGQ
jgi:hypothetical protein